MKREISKEDQEAISKEIKDTIVTLPCVVTPKKTVSFTARRLTALTQFCTKYSIFLIDGLHFAIADLLGCDFFITSDKDLLNKLQQLIRQTKTKGGVIQVVSAKQFKDNLLSRYS